MTEAERKVREHAIAEIYWNQCRISPKYVVVCRCGWEGVAQTRYRARQKMKEHKADAAKRLEEQR